MEWDSGLREPYSPRAFRIAAASGALDDEDFEKQLNSRQRRALRRARERARAASQWLFAGGAAAVGLTN